MNTIRLIKNPFKKLWLSIGVILLLFLSLPGQALLAKFFCFHITSLPGLPFFMTGILSYPFGRNFFTSIAVPSLIFFSFLPLIFFIYGTLKANKRSFLIVFITFTALIMLFNLFLFCSNWSRAIHYHGIDFLYHSVVKNIVSFLAIYLLIAAYFVKRRPIFLHIALLFFCVTISIVAFPWLGENI